MSEEKCPAHQHLGAHLMQGRDGGMVAVHAWLLGSTFFGDVVLFLVGCDKISLGLGGDGGSLTIACHANVQVCSLPCAHCRAYPFVQPPHLSPPPVTLRTYIVPLHRSVPPPHHRGDKYSDSGLVPYGTAKLYNLMFARELASRVPEIDVFGVHPGERAYSSYHTCGVVHLIPVGRLSDAPHRLPMGMCLKAWQIVGQQKCLMPVCIWHSAVGMSLAFNRTAI